MTAETGEGYPVELFGTFATPEATQTTSMTSFHQHTVVKGTALFAKLRISQESGISLWHETTGPNRIFMHGFHPFHWPEQEEIEFPERDGTTRTFRCSLTLRQEPLRRIFAAGPASHCSDCTWLVFEETVGEREEPYIPCEVERPLFSFLAGRRVPYLWWDRVVNESELERTYFGWQRFSDDEDASCASQPLPLGDSVEAIELGKDVVEELPRLLIRHAGIENKLSISWIMSPLWAAHRVVLDDRLALACVSLERLKDAIREYRAVESVAPKTPFWKPSQSKKVRRALTDELTRIGGNVNLNDSQFNVLSRRIANLGQPTNIDSIRAVFDYVGIVLSDKEIDTLNNRNRSLHRRRTLVDSGQVENVDEELQRFDTLRMLIHRAILRVLQYKGPYVDYASRPEQGNFLIKRLPSRCDPL